MSNKDYKEILWKSHFSTNGYGIWGRRSVESLQSSNDFLVKIDCPYPLDKRDPFEPLQRIELKDPYIVHNCL